MFSETDVRQMLRVSGIDRIDLFNRAVAARTKRFGRDVIVRAVCEVTNVCRVDCDFCPMRRSNTRENAGYRMRPADLIETAIQVRKHRVSNVICLQGGEIPQTTKIVAAAMPTLRAMFRGDVEIMLNLGSKTHDEYARLRASGATSYILKHETSDTELHQLMRHEPLEKRWACLEDLLSLGYRVGSGMIVGLPGQSVDSVAADIIACRDAGVHMMSAAPFIPAPNTPLADAAPGDAALTLTVMAVMRMVNPDWIIPTVSALRHLDAGGQARGFDAGANAMVYNATPERFRDKYLIYGKNRRVSEIGHVTKTIHAAGLFPARSMFVVPRKKAA